MTRHGTAGFFRVWRSHFFLATKFTAVAPCLISLPRLELGPNLRARCFALICAWRGGRVVDCTALEMRHRCKPIGGSNPPLSALRPDRLGVAGHPQEEKGASDLHFKQLCPSFRDAPKGADPESIMPQGCWEKWILRCATAHRSSRLRAPRNDEHYFGAHLRSRDANDARVRPVTLPLSEGTGNAGA
jgi:hypothetical protein